MFGKVIEFLVAEVLREFGRFRRHHDRARSYLHLLPRLTHSQAHVNAGDASGVDCHSCIDALLKTGLLDLHAIVPGIRKLTR